MKIFDKNHSIIFIFLVIIFLISIYFLTKNENTEIIQTSDLYITEEPSNTIEEDVQIVIHIDGEVINPGLVYLPTEARIADAISAAGGTTDLANTSVINLAYEVKDGQKIYVPSIYDNEQIVYIQNDAGDNVLPEESSSQNSLININSATKTELETLPGIGNSTATKIIDYRTKNGDFKKIEDIMNVSGIGEAKFNNIKDYICI